MIRFRSLLAAAVVAVSALATASCGSSSTVENDTCPAVSDANGGAAYYPEVGTNDDNNIVGQLIPQMPHTHISPGKKVTYTHDPPTSGCHYNLSDDQKTQYGPIPRGVYTKHVDAEYWMHNLEHGYIAVLYDCGDSGAGGCPSDFAAVRTWAGALPVDPGLLQFSQSSAASGRQFMPYTKILVIPWSGFGHKFAVVSWDYYLPLDSADTAMMQKFYDNHVGHSPEGLASQ